MKALVPSRLPCAAALLCWIIVLACGESSPPAPSPSVAPPPTTPIRLSAEDRAMLERLKALHSASRFDQGVAEARAYLAQRPEALRVHYALGSLLGSLQDHRGARDAFRSELARDPGHLESLRGLATSATRLGELEASLSPLEAILAARPEDGDAAYQLGRNLSALGRYEEAERHLENAIRWRPEPSSATELGLLRRRQGNLAAAEAAFRSALSQDPLHPTALLNLGQVVQRQGRLEEGAALMRHHQRVAALADRLDHAERDNSLPRAGVDNLLQLADAQRRRGFTEQAHASLERALALDPQATLAVLLLADMALEAGDLASAKTWAIQALVVAPNSAEARFLLGLTRLRSGEREAGDTMLATARAASSWRVDAFLAVADAYLEISDPETAHQTYMEGQQLAPEHPEVALGLARTALASGDRSAAIVHLEQATALAPDNALGWLLLALAQREGSPGASEAGRRAVTLTRATCFSEAQLDVVLAPLLELPGGAAFAELHRRRWTQPPPA
ncbi:MAG: tetratricopeptide repeat protein [Acidobacteriota bacterium]